MPNKPLVISVPLRRMTQAELATQLGVMQGTLSKYETGFQEPPSEFVSELSNALGYPEGFFYEVGRPYGLPPFHWRGEDSGAWCVTALLNPVLAVLSLRPLEVGRENRCQTFQDLDR